MFKTHINKGGKKRKHKNKEESWNPFFQVFPRSKMANQNDAKYNIYVNQNKHKHKPLVRASVSPTQNTLLFSLYFVFSFFFKPFFFFPFVQRSLPHMSKKLHICFLSTSFVFFYDFLQQYTPCQLSSITIEHPFQRLGLAAHN